MYHGFYGLRESPFALTPDPRYLYLSEAHKEALASMTYGIQERKGFVLILGEVGTGKTTLIRHMLGRFGANVRAVFLFNTAVSFDELLEAILRDLEVPCPGRRRIDMIDALNEYLLGETRAGRCVVVILDEAQHLPGTVLEQIRLLSNLETARGKLLQIILVGQPELGEKLGLPELRQLRQRIGLIAELRPLTYAETTEYITHRLEIAGYRRAGSLLTRPARQAVYRASRGIPRLINVICDKGMVLAYAAGAQHVRRRFIRQVTKDWSVFRQASRSAGRRASAVARRRRGSHHSRPLVAAALVLAVTAVGLLVAGPAVGDRWSQVLTAWVTPVATLRLVRQSSGLATPVAGALAPASGTAGVPADTRAGVDVPPAPQLPTAPEPAGADRPADRASTPSPPTAPAGPAVSVPRGATLSPILKHGYGRPDSTVVDVVKDANPELTDINRMAEGRVLRLPALGPAAMIHDAAGSGYAVLMATVSRTDGRDLQSWLAGLDLGGLTVRLVAVRFAETPEVWYRVLVGPFSTAAEAEAFYRNSPSPPDTLTALWR